MKSHVRSLSLIASIFSLFLLTPPAGSQSVSLSRATVSFGGHAVGRPSSPITVILVNPDTAIPLEIGSITTSGNYSETDDCNGLVAPSGSCTFSIVFTANASGSFPGVVTLTDNAPDSPQLIPLTGTGLLPVVTAPTTLTFPTIAVGSSSPAQNVTLTNNLATAVNIKFHSSADFTVAGGGQTPCGSSLSSKASCTIAVQFGPTTSGTIDGALTIQQSINGTPQIVPLTGTGSGGTIAPLAFKPGSYGFGSVAVGLNSQTTIFVTNNSKSAVNILSLAASGDYTVAGGSTSPCGGSLAANAQCTLLVTFQPTATTEIDGAVSITDNGSVKTQTMNLSGRGVQAVGLSPSTLTFPVQQQGGSSAPQVITVSNRMSSTLTINSITTTGDFASTTTCGATLAPAASCLISVTFNPIARTGAVNGTLTVNSSAPSSPAMAQLQGQSTGSLTRFAYVANRHDNTISMYTANNRTGQLRPIGYVASGRQPDAIVVAPSNKFAYVTNNQDNTVSVFLIDPVSGLLNLNADLTTATGNIPNALVLTPAGNFAYVANDDNTISGYAVNTSSGTLTPLSGSPFPAGDVTLSIAVSPNGKFVYAVNAVDGNISGYQINASTGALTAAPGSPFTAGSLPWAITVDPSGKFVYAANFGDGTVSAYSINSSTGALTPITGSPYATGSEPVAVAVDLSGRYIYLSNSGAGSISAFSINPSSGALTSVTGSPFPTPASDPLSLTVDTTNQFLYVGDPGADNISTFTINSASGALSLLKVAPARVGPVAAAVISGTVPVTYFPKFVYTTDFDGVDILGFSLNSFTGEVSSLSDSPFHSQEPNPTIPSSDALNRWLYLGDFGAGTVAAYNIDPNSGSITPTAGSPYPSGAGTYQAYVDPTERFAYVLSSYTTTPAPGLVSAYSIDPADGKLTAISGSPYTLPFDTFSLFGSAIDPSGRYLYVGSGQLVAAFAINPSTGALTNVPGSPFSVNLVVSSLLVDASGRFVYIGSNEGTSWYAIHQSDGSLSTLAGSNTNSGYLLTSEPSGRFMFAPGSLIYTYTVDVNTGALTQVSSTPFSDVTVFGVQTDPSGSFLYLTTEITTTTPPISGGIYEYGIDPVTGALTQLSGSPVPQSRFPSYMTITGIYH